MLGGESVIGRCVGGMEMVGLSEGNHLGTKKNMLRSNQAVLQINFRLLLCFLFSWKMQNASFSTSLFVYSSLQLIRDPRSFLEFCNSYSISLLIWQLDQNEFLFFEKNVI